MNSGSDIINDLGGVGAADEDDVLIVSSATVNATNYKFVATNASKYEGTANLTAKSTGGHIDMTLSTTSAYTITGSANTDTLKAGMVMILYK